MILSQKETNKEQVEDLREQESMAGAPLCAEVHSQGRTQLWAHSAQSTQTEPNLQGLQQQQQQKL